MQKEEKNLQSSCPTKEQKLRNFSGLQNDAAVSRKPAPKPACAPVPSNYMKTNTLVRERLLCEIDFQWLK